MTRFTNKFQFDSNGLPALDANAAVLNEHYADLMQHYADKGISIRRTEQNFIEVGVANTNNRHPTFQFPVAGAGLGKDEITRVHEAVDKVLERMPKLAKELEGIKAYTYGPATNVSVSNGNRYPDNESMFSNHASIPSWQFVDASGMAFASSNDLTEIAYDKAPRVQETVETISQRYTDACRNMKDLNNGQAAWQDRQWEYRGTSIPVEKYGAELKAELRDYFDYGTTHNYVTIDDKPPLTLSARYSTFKPSGRCSLEVDCECRHTPTFLSSQPGHIEYMALESAKTHYSETMAKCDNMAKLSMYASMDLPPHDILFWSQTQSLAPLEEFSVDSAHFLPGLEQDHDHKAQA